MKVTALWRVVALGVTAALAGCHQTDDEGGCRPDPAADAPAATVRLRHLERPFFQIKNPAQGLQFLQANPVFARYYLQVGRVPADSAAATLARLATNPSLQRLGREAATAFPDSAALQRELGAMLGRVKYYFPDFRVPPVTATYVSGLYGKGVFVNDSLLVVNLDWYIGPKASYRPQLPQYILRNYHPAAVLPELALAVAGKYNKHNLLATSMLDQMVDHGKRLYFAGRVLPCAPDSLLLGYSGKELRNLRFNEAKVWGHFLENNLLYATNTFEIRKYVDDRPNVPEIDRAAPGRIGQWVGLQIVRKYMADHPGVTLAQLMADTNAQHILDESHYRPKR